MRLAAVVLCVVPAVGCVGADDNDAPRYADGNASNCRAYVQVAIDAHAARLYTPDQIFAGLERNCGANGWLWKDRRKSLGQ